MSSGVKIRSVRARNQVESATVTALERIFVPSQTAFTMEFFKKELFWTGQMTRNTINVS